MKHFLLVLLLSALGGAAAAQKIVNDPNAEPRAVTSFHAIQVSSSFEVIITQGTEEALAVSANNKEDMADIKTSVDKGVLKIWFDQKNKWWPKNRKLRAYVSFKNLDQLRAGGSSTVRIEGALNADNLELDLSGASDVKGRIVVKEKMNVDLSGASDLEITGSASEMTVEASGASRVKAYDFTVTNCSVDASGASSVRVSVDKELSAKLSGASSVSYKGTAVIRDIKTSGASSISKKS